MNSTLLFTRIAPIYALFYSYQKKRYRKTISEMKDTLDVTRYSSVVDIGCGSGALANVLAESGLNVTAVDGAEGMIKWAKKKNNNSAITFLHADVLAPLQLEDKRFDLAITSYVAHGMMEHERKRLYALMSRLAINYVIIHDYNDKRGFLTSIIEWMERGDYFTFIKQAKEEMEKCVSELKTCFDTVEVVQVGKRANWYICTPAKES